VTKATAYQRSIAEARKAWANSQWQECMACGATPQWPPLAVHEIERRSHAPATWAAECNFLLLCEPCHSGPFATMPHARQLAYKYLRDQDHFDLDAWLRLNDPALKAPNRVTMEEILAAVEEIRTSSA
jgi:5-methylcytosine-specific restriction endonuclease McrA